MTLAVTIVGLASVVGGIGVGSDPLRDLSIAVLLVFGVSLLAPALSARIEAPLSRLARFGPRSRGDGFRSGLLVGGALGFVYTPCASPILAAVIIGERGERADGLAGAGLRGRIGRGPAAARVRRQEGLRPRAPGRPGTRPAAGARRGDDRHRGAAGDQPGRELRRIRRPAHPQRQPHRGPGVLAHRHQRLHEITGHKARFVAANGSSSCGGSGSAAHLTAAGPSASQATLLADARSLPNAGAAPEFTRHRALVQHPRRASRCRSPRCGEGWCWWTSGPTPASTASAPCPT